jgi:hypothetical protein
VDEGFYGAWFEGEIVEHVYPDKCVIKYLELREVRRRILACYGFV